MSELEELQEKLDSVSTLTSMILTESKKDFLIKPNKITRNRYRQFLNIAKQKSDIRRHSTPKSSLFYKKSKTKRRRNTRSRKSI
jgi:hypothetical protein